MNESLISELGAWVVDAGLIGTVENDLLRGFCERAVAGGLPISRATLVVDTLHPVHEGRVFRWGLDQKDDREIIEYGRLADDTEANENWRRSPFYHLLETGGSMLRRSQPRGHAADFHWLLYHRPAAHTR